MTEHAGVVLVVDDDGLNQMLLTTNLQQQGYQVASARDGRQALEMLHAQPFDVVLLDLLMPEMDSLEAARRIRLGGQSNLMPYVIAMTANAMKDDRDICLQAGMNDYLSKPIQIGDLVAALTQAGHMIRPDQSAPYGQTPVSAPGEQTGASAPILDPAVIRRLRETLGPQAEALLPDLIASFCTEAPHLIQAARVALDQGHITDLRRAAHTLKSSSATFGAMALSDLARQLERRANDGMLQDADALLDQIHKAYERAWAALEVLK